jgi:hypothetical protein
MSLMRLLKKRGRFKSPECGSESDNQRSRTALIGGAGLFGNPKLRCVFWIPEHQRGNAELGDVIPEYSLP